MNRISHLRRIALVPILLIAASLGFTSDAEQRAWANTFGKQHPRFKGGKWRARGTPGAFGKCRYTIDRGFVTDPRFNHALRHELAAWAQAEEEANSAAYNG